MKLDLLDSTLSLQTKNFNGLESCEAINAKTYSKLVQEFNVSFMVQ